MPAPPSDLITALRSGTVSRHLFFKMDHSQGVVLAWDGVGEFKLGADVYSGVGGFATLEGVSDTGDIQNQDITATLNGVSLPSLAEVDPDVRNRAVTITAAWITEAGSVLESRAVFVGTADILKLSADENSQKLSVTLRGPLAEWRTPPRAYYTPGDQSRRFAGDTGFKFVKDLENATIAGWGEFEESSGGHLEYVANYYLSFGSLNISFGFLRDDVTDAIYGIESWGLTYLVLNNFTDWTAVNQHTDSENFIDAVTSDSVVLDSFSVFPAAARTVSVQLYTDVSNIARTNGGNVVVPAGEASTNKLRAQSTISADGSTTGTTVSSYTRTFNSSSFSETGLQKTGATMSGNDQSGLVYDNKNGNCVDVISGIPQKVDTTRTAVGTYVEATTGTAVVVSSGLLKVGGSNCVVSTTGVILTPAGHRVVLSGGSAAEFLRVWA